MIEPTAPDQDRLEQQLIALERNPQAPHDTTVCNLHQELETLADDLRQPVPVDPHEAESACQRAVEQIQTLATGHAVKPSRPAGEEDSELKPETEIGQYKILAKLGQGGMGAVYKALHTKLDKIVALKVLPEDRLEKPDAVARFGREMKAVGKIEHPHLVRALDAGESEGCHYLVMEYVDGVDLSRLLKQHDKLPVATACELVRQAALGLQAAHQSGMVHRDIKPANLMLARQEFGPPTVKVLDLGLARLADESGQLETELTTDNQIMGTLDFMAPEQAGNSRGVDTRVDIYSLGATLFMLLTGRPPYAGPEHQTIIQKLNALASEPLPSIKDLRPDVPPGLVTVLQKMLAKDRDERYAEPMDVAKALKPFANESGLAALLDEADTLTSTPSMIRSTSTWAAPSTAATVGLTKPSRRCAFIAAALLLALAPLVYLYAGTIIRFATNQGELVIEIDDPNIEVKVLQNGAIVQDKTKDREFTLTAGKGEIEVLEKDGIKLTTKEFQLTRGKKTILKVTLKELADARTKPIPVKPRPSNSNPGLHPRNFALEFDGMADFVEIPSIQYQGSNAITIESLVHLKSYAHGTIVRGMGNEGSPSLWVKPDGTVNGHLHTRQNTVAETSEIPLSKTVHVACVWDGQKVRIFLNGKNSGCAAERKALAWEDAGFFIGGLKDAYFLHGTLDEVRISNMARYTKDFTPAKRHETDEHTLALYHFDEGSGDVLKDSSGNGHHGKIVGATWVKENGTNQYAPVEPEANYALSFDGQDDYVKTPVTHDGKSPDYH